MSTVQLSPVVRVVMCYTHNPYSFEGAVGVLRCEILAAPAMAGKRSSQGEVDRVPTPSPSECPPPSPPSAEGAGSGCGCGTRESPSAPPCSHSDFWKRLRVKR
eukprot:RCo007636